MANSYSIDELREFGIHLTGSGKNITVSRKSSIYNPSNFYIGDNTRIDDFCVLSGGEIRIGNHCHIGTHVFMTSGTKIVIGDIVGVSSGTKLFGRNDDYSGEYLALPTIPDKYKKITIGEIIIKDLCIVASNCVILPNVILGEGSVLGAMSLLKTNIPDYEIYGGSPAKFIKQRKRNIRVLADEFIRSYE